MVLFNYSTRELTAKIVYYGPGLCGKTTNLQFVHENLPGEVRGKMLSLATKTDRTLFFDFLPIDLGEIRGMKTRVQLYTVPGQVFYNETRKLVLKGADGIVFVADSQETMLGANVESFKNLDENLKAHGMKLAEMPHVIQFNKRDLPKLSGIEDLNAALNKFNAPFYESVATSGIGVQDTLKAIVKLVLLNLTKKYDPKSVPSMTERAASVAVPAAMPKPAPAPMPAAQAAPAAPAPARAEAPMPPIAQPPKPAKRAVPPAPAPRLARTPPPTEAMPPFEEAEIDGLMDEVGEMDAPPIATPAAVPAPVAAMAAPAEDDGIWLGAPEGDEASSFADPAMTFGANVSIEDMLAKEAASPDKAVAPSPIEAAPWHEVASFGSSFEVDRGFDPEFTPSAPMPPAPEKAASKRSRKPEPEVVQAKPSKAPEPMRDDQPIVPFPFPTDDAADDVLLTEVASGEDLFNDPSLEVARLAEGAAREIIVPVQVGEGPHARRYKLAIRLRLEPVD